jgi:hypothetical protein
VLHKSLNLIGGSIRLQQSRLGQKSLEIYATVSNRVEFRDFLGEALAAKWQGRRLRGGKSGISADMAIRLDKAFGGGAETWLRLQMAYDLAQARKREKEIHARRVRRATHVHP